MTFIVDILYTPRILLLSLCSLGGGKYKYLASLCSKKHVFFLFFFCFFLFFYHSNYTSLKSLGTLYGALSIWSLSIYYHSDQRDEAAAARSESNY